MRINKSYILLIGLALLVVLALLVKQRGSSLSNKDRISTFVYNENIDRIELSTQETKITLHYLNGKWLLEDQKEADTELIKNLFKFLELLNIQSAVSSEDKKDIEQKMNTNGRILNVYSGKKLVYSIAVGQNNNKDFAITPSGKPYYISIKGNSSESLYKRLKPNPTSWQDRILINLNPEEISSVRVEYLEEKEKSFFIENNDRPILYNSKREEVSNIDAETLTDYQYFFNGIAYALVDTSIQKPDVNKHLFSLRINTNISKVIAIEAYELVDLKTRQKNNNSFAGIVNNSILVELNYSDFDPIVVDIDYFLKK